MHGERRTEVLLSQRFAAWWFFLSNFHSSRDINGNRVERTRSLPAVSLANWLGPTHLLQSGSSMSVYFVSLLSGLYAVI